MIKGVLWDLGGVLCQFAPDRRSQSIASQSGRPLDEVASLLDGPLLRALDRGELNGATLRRLIHERLEWPCSDGLLATAWSAAFQPDEAVLALARRVAVPTGVLSDNGPPLSDHFGDVLPDVAAVVAVAVFSSEIGRTKPHREAYLAACDQLGTSPSETLLIDDHPANVDGARRVGLPAVHFTTVRSLESALHDAGVLH